MAFFKKKTDPLDDRARHLRAEIAAVEATIKKLEKTSPGQSKPASQFQPARPGATATPPPRNEPIFEPINQKRIHAPVESRPQSGGRSLETGSQASTGVWEKVKKQFHAPSSDNPRLVSYLAAGSIQGLRPLRYEKRVARNRFLLLVTILVLMVIGGCYFYWRNR